MSSANKRIIVLGSGVSGLSSAIALSEAGYSVRIVSSRRTPNTISSDVAAAFWYPFHVEGYKEQWAERTYRRLQELILEGCPGVCNVVGKEFFPTEADMQESLPAIWWKSIPDVRFAVLARTEVPSGFEAGVTFTVPVIRMPNYMRYLEDRFLARCPGRIESLFVKHVDDLLSDCDLLVNCTGLGSRDLGGVADRELYACQGQVVIVKPLDFHELIFVTSGKEFRNEPLYIVPRCGYDILLGGTTYDGRESLQPRKETAEKILHRCSELYPIFRTAEIIEGVPRVGLRPCHKQAVRVTADERKPIIHNYGHGGAGVTLSWGCAEEVLSLVRHSII